MKLRIMNMYYIQRCHTRTCIRLPGQPLLVCTVWTYMYVHYACRIHTVRLAASPVCQRRRYAYTNTPLSLVTDPLCYINLTFVKRTFAKLYYVNLLGTFVVLVFCIQARFNHVKSKK